MEVRPGYKQTEVGVIPEGWTIVTLENTSTSNGLIRGPFGGALKKSFFTGHGYKVYEQRNAIYKTHEIGDYYINLEKFKELERFRIRPGDYIVSCSGTIGCIYQIPSGAPDGVINQALLKISLNGEMVDDKYFLAIFQSESFQNRIKENSHGGAMQNLVGMDIFRKTQFQLPPKIEQEAIAEALSDADALIESVEQLIAKKRQIKQGAMQELLTGEIRLPGFEGEWEEKRLGDIAKIQRGASPRPIDSPIWFDSNSFIGWVRISDVTGSGMFLTGTSQRLSSLGIQHSRLVSAESLIMSICATVGRPIITKIDVCIHDGFVVFDNLDADHFFLFYILKWIEPNWTKHGQTGSQMNLNTGLINETIVKLPPRKEQSAIATILSDMDEEISALESKLAKTRQLKQGMMQELLTGRIRLI